MWKRSVPSVGSGSGSGGVVGGSFGPEYPPETPGAPSSRPANVTSISRLATSASSSANAAIQTLPAYRASPSEGGRSAGLVRDEPLKLSPHDRRVRPTGPPSWFTAITPPLSDPGRWPRAAPKNHDRVALGSSYAVPVASPAAVVGSQPRRDRAVAVRPGSVVASPREFPAARRPGGVPSHPHRPAEPGLTGQRHTGSSPGSPALPR